MASGGARPLQFSRSTDEHAGSLLDVQSTTVRFGGVVANDDVSVQVAETEVVAVIGPNGAGKTTLFNVITGAIRPAAGRVLFNGVDLTEASPFERARCGLARTFQNLSLVPSLDGVENVTVGLGPYRWAGMVRSVLGFPTAARQDRQIRALAAAALEFVGATHAAHIRAAELPYGDRRRVELARALALSPTLLLLDEPTAGMDPAETVEMADVILRIRSEMGISVLVVEHDMSFVRALADHVTVLDFGRVIASGDTDRVLRDRRVVEAYLGRSSDDRA